MRFKRQARGACVVRNRLLPEFLTLSFRLQQNRAMLFYFAALSSREVLDASCRCFERVMNHHLKIAVRRLGLHGVGSSRFPIDWRAVDHNRLSLHDNFLARQSQVNADVERLALLMMAVRLSLIHISEP